MFDPENILFYIPLIIVFIYIILEYLDYQSTNKD